MKTAFWKKALHCFIAFTFLNAQLSPIYAEDPAVGNIIPDTSISAKRPSMEVASNGVPVVEIVAPNNASGLSHNLLHDFNVGTIGVVVNNSRETGYNFSGGIVLGNPNLQGKSLADTILFEITGTNQSKLCGPLEVFGRSADFVLANPNGVRVNGGSFINTPRVTLTTGLPEIDIVTGTLKELVVDTNSTSKIFLDGPPLSLKGMDSFDVIARAVKLHTILVDEADKAKIRISAGAQRYNYETKEAVANGENLANKPKLGIDGSAMGGLYAGHITLVVNEKGVGVRAPENMAARASDIDITADGNIVLRNADAKMAIKATSLSGNVTVDRRKIVHANTDVELEAAGLVDVRARAKVQSNGSLNIKGDNLNNGGLVSSQGLQKITVQHDIVNKRGAKIIAKQTLGLTAGTLTNDGKIKGKNKVALNIGGKAINSRSGKIFALDNLTMATQPLENNGLIQSSKEVELTTTSLHNQSHGQILSGGNQILKGATFINEGLALSGTTLTAYFTQNLANKGILSSMGIMGLKGTHSLINANGAQILTHKMLTLDTAAFTNNGLVQGDRTVTLDATASIRIGTTGRILAADRLKVTTQLLKNDGLLQGGEDIEIGGENFHIQPNGKVISVGKQTLIGAIFTNEGIAKSGSTLTTRFSQDFTNSGTLNATAAMDLGGSRIFKNTDGAHIQSQDKVTIQTDTFENGGLVQGEGIITLTADDSAKVGQNGQILSKNDIKITTKILENGGFISSDEKATIRANNWVHNYTTAKITSHQKLLLETKELKNDGKIVGQERVHINSTDQVDNLPNGQILGAGKLTLKTKKFENTGLVHGDQQVSMTATDALNNYLCGKILGGTGHLTLETTILENEGLIRSERGARIEFTTAVNHKLGQIIANQELTLKGHKLGNDGRIMGGNSLALTLQNHFLNKGLLNSGGTISLMIDGVLDNYWGYILAKGDITAKGINKDKITSINNTSGTIESLEGKVHLKGLKIANKRIRVEKLIRTTHTGNSHNGSRTETEYFDEANSDPIANIIAHGDVILEADEMVNSHSLVSGGGDVTLNGEKFENISTQLISTYYSWYRAVRYEKPSWWMRNVRRASPRPVYYTVQRSPISSSAGKIPSTVQATGALQGKFTDYLMTDDGLKQNTAPIGRQTPNNIEQVQTLNLEDLESFIDQASFSPLYQVNFESHANPHPNLPQMAMPEDHQTQVDNHGNPLLHHAAPLAHHKREGKKYLIETRHMHADPRHFFGSDYFLSRMDMFKGKTHYQKRMGDAFAETQLIRRQIFQATGRYLLKGHRDPSDMMKTLYDNAIDQVTPLELSPGLALTPAQIKRLRKDIIWMEEVVVRGEKVFVPRFYMASVASADYDEKSGQLLGRTVALEAPNMRLTDLVRGDESVTLTAHENVTLLGAHVDGGVTNVTAGQALNVLSSVIEGDTVAVKGGTTHIETLVQRGAITGDFTHGYQDRLQGIAQIKSRVGDATIEGTNGFSVRGASLEGAQDLILTTAAEMVIEAQQLAGELHTSHQTKNSSFTHDRQSLTHAKTILKAGRNIGGEAGGSTRLAGVAAKASGGIHFKANGELVSDTVHDVFQESTHTSSKNGRFLREKSTHDEEHSSLRVGSNTFEAGAEGTVLEANANLTDRASHYKGKAKLKSHEGKVKLLSDTAKEFHHVKKSSDSLVWQSKQDKGNQDETVNMVQAPDGLTVEAAKGVEVEIRASGNLAQSIAALEQLPGTAWVKQLTKDPNVNWGLISEAHEQWDYKSQGLTPAASAVIALAVSIATGGAGSGLAGAMGFTNAIAVGMIDAGVSQLITQASISLVNNKGNLGKVLKEMGSNASMRSLAATVATAGLVGSGSTTNLQGFAQKLAVKSVHALGKASMSAAIEGHSFGNSLKNAGLSAVVDASSESLANQIGGARKSGKLNVVTDKMVHFGLGSVRGAVENRDDPLKGALVAGTSAALAETVAEITIDRDKAGREVILEHIREGRSITDESFQAAYQEKLTPYTNIVNISVGTAALFAGQDASVAIYSSNNALENNFKGVIISIGKAAIPHVKKAANTSVNLAKKGWDKAKNMFSKGKPSKKADQGINPFKEKTSKQIDTMFRKKGFEPRGPNPAKGKGGYVNPKNGRSYHIDKQNRFNEPPHVDVNRLRDYKGGLPKRKFDMSGK